MSYVSWLGLALEIRLLTDAIINVVEGVEDENGQLLLFPIDMYTRERFAQMADTFYVCLKGSANNPKLQSVASLNALKHFRHELREFVQRTPDDKWKPMIADMLTISQDVALTKEEYFSMVEFFGGIERRCIALNRSVRVGCF
jgi:hypothetical protein